MKLGDETSFIWTDLAKKSDSTRKQLLEMWLTKMTLPRFSWISDVATCSMNTVSAWPLTTTQTLVQPASRRSNKSQRVVTFLKLANRQRFGFPKKMCPITFERTCSTQH